jgi:hypothetical protein
VSVVDRDPDGACAGDEILVRARAVQLGVPDRVAVEIRPVDVIAVDRDVGGAAGARDKLGLGSKPSSSARPIVFTKGFVQ